MYNGWGAASPSREALPLAKAGRRSAGHGGDSSARPGAHAVGVRAREEWAIWLVVGHW